MNSLNRDMSKNNYGLLKNLREEVVREIQELSIKIDEGMKDWSDAEYRANYRSELIVTLLQSISLQNIKELKIKK